LQEHSLCFAFVQPFLVNFDKIIDFVIDIEDRLEIPATGEISIVVIRNFPSSSENCDAKLNRPFNISKERPIW
jgi:hypothetical protein